jgi:single-stranded-DNA-specific exonuclease
MISGSQWRIKYDSTQATDIVDQILINRGFDTEEKRQAFLNPDFDRHLHSPALLKDMDVAVERIVQAIDGNQKIIVFGDYDADGVTSTALLIDFFDKLGVKADYILPHRITDGYGITPEGVAAAAEKSAELIITVDNGINANPAADKCAELGIDLIITDHHSQNADLPRALAVINPNRVDCPYPFKYISGVGVTFKLVTALSQKKMTADAASHFLKWSLDLVAMGTVADMVPLVEENRTLVYFGLQVIAKSRRPGLMALMYSDTRGTVDTNTIAYQLGPRINAAGRLEKADKALELLLSKDNKDALEIANALQNVNQKRQELTKTSLAEADAQLDHNDKIFILFSPAWHPGIIGLIAGKICEKYNKPVVAFGPSGDGTAFKGSARSPHYLNITEALLSAEDLLLSVGGHKQAGGCTLPVENFKAFKERVTSHVNSFMENKPVYKVFEAEMVLAAARVTLDTIASLKRLAPFGQHNPNPLFVLERVEVVSLRKVGFDQQHLQLRVRGDDMILQCIGFGLGDYLEHLKNGMMIDLMAELKENVWQNQVSAQLIIHDIRPCLKCS